MQGGADRFIPQRSSLNLDASHAALTSSVGSDVGNEAGRKFEAALSSGLLDTGVSASTASGAGTEGHRVLAFNGKKPEAPEGFHGGHSVLYSSASGSRSRAGTATGRPAGSSAGSARHIPSAPERILDAPDLANDYYLNLLDWSSADLLAVALGPTVYLWNASSGAIDELTTLGSGDAVTSVRWVKEGGGYLAVGTDQAHTQLWDVTKNKLVRTMDGHEDRIGSMDWNKHVLTTGSRDATIVHHDVRVRQHAVATLAGHSQEVCGLRWSPDGRYLASGGNDNLLCIWDAASNGATASAAGVAGVAPSASGPVAPMHKIASHRAAVKALAWCPWERNTLASGGGTADRCIKFWNAESGAQLDSVDTGSQVCALAWNPHEKELLSSHGYSQNQLTVWKYPSLARVKELTGHSARVLHLATSPDGSTVCSAGADETLRFWNVFGAPPSKASKGASASASSRGKAAGGLRARTLR